MRDKGKRGIVIAALAGAGLLAATPAAQATEPTGQTGPSETGTRASAAYADVDGDSSEEIVTLSTLDDETARISVRFDGGRQVSTTFPAAIGSVVPKPRAVDVDGNGRSEVAVTTAVGANTLTFGLFSYDPTTGTVSWLTDERGEQYTFFEGGGAAAISDYGCFSDSEGRHFERVDAQGDPGQSPVTYSGDRSWFTLDGTTLRFVSHLHFEHVTRDDPMLHTDRSACSA